MMSLGCCGAGAIFTCSPLCLRVGFLVPLPPSVPFAIAGDASPGGPRGTGCAEAGVACCRWSAAGLG